MLKERKSLCQLIEVTDKQLHEMNYSQAVIYSYRRCWRELIEYAEERNVTYYSVELGEKYLLEKRGIDIYADKKTLNLPRWKINPFMRAINVLTDMQNIGVIRKIYHVDRIKLPENYSNIAEQFCSKCRQRYNSERTIIAKDFAVKRFLNHLIQTNILSIDSITSKDITSYLKTTISWSQRTVALAICNLKQFLSFLYEEKYIKTDISLWIPTANHGRAATLPNIWTQDDIERLLSSVDRANPIGKRDYAILLLVARLGLRDSDVQNLTFSNILWKECRISLVQTKTKRALDLPITEEIGNAIIEYLKYGRPKHIVWLKSTALSIFLSKWSAGTNHSMLNISSWSRFSLPFTITFITASIIPYLRKKAQLLLDFFDRLSYVKLHITLTCLPPTAFYT